MAKTSAKEAAYLKRLTQLEDLVQKYDASVKRWDSGKGPADEHGRVTELHTELHDDAWYTLLEFYRRNR